MFQIVTSADNTLEIRGNGKLLLRHSIESPALFLGRGNKIIEVRKLLTYILI